MSIYVVRHYISEANNRENIGTPAFGNPDAELMEIGRQQARQDQRSVLSRFAVANSDIPVAISEMRRTAESASELGFKNQRTYPVLNEIDTSRVEPLALRKMLDTGELPPTAYSEAVELYYAPPPEKIWFTHAGNAAAFFRLLDIYQDQPLIMKFGEVREIPDRKDWPKPNIKPPLDSFYRE